MFNQKFCCRGKRFMRKRSYRTSPITPDSKMFFQFFQYLVPCSQRVWESKTDPKFETPKSVSQKQHFKMDILSQVLNLVKPNDWAI